jgi:hypothetical protein
MLLHAITPEAALFPATSSSWIRSEDYWYVQVLSAMFALQSISVAY